MSLSKKLKKLNDKEVLELLNDLIKEKNVKSGVRFIQSPDEPITIGYQSVLICGDLMLPAEPVMFDWPMQHLPMPEAFKNNGKVN